MSKPTVLVVDDEASQRTAVVQMIERWGFCADAAADGAEAFRKLEERPFEVLITDLGKISSLRVISRTSVMQYKSRKNRCQRLRGS